MNHIFRSLWNPRTCTCVAISEHASGGCKVAGVADAPIQSRTFEFPVRQLACALMFAFGALVQAEPTGGVVAAGRATIAGTAGQMTVTQTTAKVAINWQSFGIQAGESVQFVQPSRSSVALNRVTGADASQIFGKLSSNGQLFLVNPSGILFGPSASVNVGGLVAATLNINDADFMSGYYRFSGAGSGGVVNQGAIRAVEGGYVALLGNSVNNQGVVMAQLGTVLMASGQAMTLDVSGDQLLNVVIDQGVANAWVNNGGLVQADGGKVLMTTQVAGHLLANAVNNTGVVQAQTLESHNGTIMLLSSMEAGTVSISGALDVSGGAGLSGGRVVATAHHVGLFNAHINASGDGGGGEVLMGGDYQGQNPNVPNASAVYMSQDSAIHADAQTLGQGGRVVLWSNDSTRAYGRLSARGGEQGGDGGLIETSGHWLDVMGAKVDTRASHGQIGTWLLDPADVTISSAVTSDGAVSGGVFAPNSGVATANVNVADLVAALGVTNVTVTTTNTGVSGAGQGDIHVNAAVTWTVPTTLTLNAAHDVNVNQAITGTGGSLVVNAGHDVLVGAAVTTTSGNLSYTAAHDVTLNAANTITTGNLTAVAGSNVTVSAASTVTTGNMVFHADNDGTGPGATAGTVDISCGASCLTVTTGVLDIRFNPASYGSTASEISAYGGKLTGGGTLAAKAWVFGLGDNKTYDATTTATVSGLKPGTTSVMPTLSLGTVSNANFDGKNVGVAKPITYQSTFTDTVYALFTRFGTPAGTYQARADVLVRPITVSASTDARAYDGTTHSVALPTATGLQSGDTLNGALTQNFANKNAMGTGNSTLVPNGAYTVSDGNGGNNYAVTVVTAPGTIIPAALSIKAEDVSKLDGQTPVLTGFTTSALVNGETVGSVTQTSPGQSALATVVGSPYAIHASAATGGTFVPSNYTITYVDGVLTVLPVAVVPPVVIPPIVIPPVVIPPVVLPPVVTAPTLVPPVVDIPEVHPTTVAPPVAELPPVVIDPSVAPLHQGAVDAVSVEQSRPKVPKKDVNPALLVVATQARIVQGPVIFPAAVALLNSEQPRPRLLVLPLRPPKQDRN